MPVPNLIFYNHQTHRSAKRKNPKKGRNFALLSLDFCALRCRVSPDRPSDRPTDRSKGVGGMMAEPVNPPRWLCQLRRRVRSLFAWLCHMPCLHSMAGMTLVMLYWGCANAVLNLPYLTALFEDFEVLPRRQPRSRAEHFSFGGVPFPILAPSGVSLDSSC